MKKKRVCDSLLWISGHDELLESQIVASGFDRALNAAMVNGLVDLVHPPNGTARVFLTKRGREHLADKKRPMPRVLTADEEELLREWNRWERELLMHVLTTYPSLTVAEAIKILKESGGL
jgi:hypothetical protein